MNRNIDVFELRPAILTDADRLELPIENFQNKVLRPILKFQHELLINYFKNHNAYKLLPPNPKERMLVLQNSFNKDVALRNLYLGFIVGLFTTDELLFYNQHQTELNKRTVQMLLQRLLSTL
jgi:hypothetical protein